MDLSGTLQGVAALVEMLSGIRPDLHAGTSKVLYEQQCLWKEQKEANKSNHEARNCAQPSGGEGEGTNLSANRFAFRKLGLQFPHIHDGGRRRSRSGFVQKGTERCGHRRI